MQFLGRRGFFRMAMGTMSATALATIGSSAVAANISEEVRTSLLTLYVAMFNSAPDGDTLDAMISDWESGKSIIEIAGTLDNEEFRLSYPAFLTHDEFAERFLEVLFGDGDGGYIAPYVAVERSRKWIIASLESGRSDTQIISQLASEIVKTEIDIYQNTIARLSNKVELADVYARTVQTHPKDQEGNSDNSIARTLIANVTPDRTSISSVIDRILDGTLDFGPSYEFVPAYASPA